MAQYTILDTIAMQCVLENYGIVGFLSHKILSGGSENTNYLVKTKSKNYVVTVCEQKSLEKTIELAFLLEYLERNKFATSKIIKENNKDYITVWNNKPVMVKEFIEGSIIEDLPKNLLIALGKELAKLHRIEAPSYLPKTVSYGIERFDEVLDYAPNSEFYKWLKTTQKYIEKQINPELPKALIHSDIFDNNVIVSADRSTATIMDFEEACYYYRIFDIGMMIVGLCRSEKQLDLAKMKAILIGYQQEIQLVNIEKKALQAFTVYAAAATAFWRHQNFNHVNVDPTMKDHYLEMKQLADAIMKFPSNSFI
ncbi:homoserine kinase [uncultured Tenacibaculum sp.]|uniref:homoserine kinase n=1 Tax=uncultured Tenacibaculum sp. TaxID=174713 RepID=UPI002601E685|nr:homoserine kinase [uncultured Tenacibaculum sp.]